MEVIVAGDCGLSPSGRDWEIFRFETSRGNEEDFGDRKDEGQRFSLPQEGGTLTRPWSTVTRLVE